jgi:hypothetical protein
MSATLKLTRETIGVEVHRGAFEVFIDGQGVGWFQLHDTFETSVAPGRHTLQVREGRYSSRELSFQVSDGQVISFNCQGKRILPIFLASFVVPSLALTLTPR